MIFRLIIAALTVVQACNAFMIPGVRRDAVHKKGRSPVVADLRVHPRQVNVRLRAEQATSGIDTLKSWDPSARQAFIQPAVHNKNPVRAAALVAVTAIVARGSLLVPGSIAKFLHLMSFAAWVGSNLWVTFIAGITMYRNLPRRTFGKIQAKLFPAYFLLNFCATLAICTIRPFSFSPASVAIVVALVCNMLNMVVLEPESTRIMMKRYELEDEKKGDSDEYKRLGQAFGKYHGLSSLFNLLALMAAFVYTWELGAKMA